MNQRKMKSRRRFWRARSRGWKAALLLSLFCGGIWWLGRADYSGTLQKEPAPNTGYLLGAAYPQSEEMNQEPAITLPAAYDYRQAGRASKVENQENLGTCWAFAALSALETSLLPEESWDFSEDHMSIQNSFHMGQNAGGDYTMSLAYLLAWQGPVAEEDDPYGDGKSPDGLDAEKHLQEVQFLPEGDIEAIKRAVFLVGGVQSSLYTSLQDASSESAYYRKEKAAYYYNGDEPPNHDSVIVGWDDNFPKEAFTIQPPGDGAFLCMNSWGEAFGDGGYFYVSYYDSNIGRTNLSYTRIEEPDNYSRIYQTDLCGWSGQAGYGGETVWAANVYQAQGHESLAAAGFYATGPDTSYEIYGVTEVNLSSETEVFQDPILLASGKLENAGYYTIDFSSPVTLEEGQDFAVMIKITTPGTTQPAAIEYQADGTKGTVDIQDGWGYLSNDGVHWQRAETTMECNICLKAYTRSIS